MACPCALMPRRAQAPPKIPTSVNHVWRAVPRHSLRGARRTRATGNRLARRQTRNVTLAAGELVLKHTISIRSGAFRAGVLAGALGLGLIASGPAAAQFVYWGHRAQAYPVVPPEDAAAAVRSMGWRPVGVPMRHGPAYVMSAIDPAGQELRVVVDARTGRVVRSAPVYVPRYAAMPPNYGRPPGRIPLAGPDIADDDPRIAACRLAPRLRRPAPVLTVRLRRPAPPALRRPDHPHQVCCPRRARSRRGRHCRAHGPRWPRPTLRPSSQRRRPASPQPRQSRRQLQRRLHRQRRAPRRRRARLSHGRRQRCAASRHGIPRVRG